MSSKKKLDPSKVSQSISIPVVPKHETVHEQSAPTNDSESAAVTDSVSQPASAGPARSKASKAKDSNADDHSPLNAKGRYETSFRYAEETRNAMFECIEACQSRRELKDKIIQKTLLEIGAYGLSKLDPAALKTAVYDMPEVGRATYGSPLRLSGDYYERVMVPLIQNYSDALKSHKGANVSRMVVLGIHYLDSMRKRNVDEFLDHVEQLCSVQYDEGLKIC